MSKSNLQTAFRVVPIVCVCVCVCEPRTGLGRSRFIAAKSDRFKPVIAGQIAPSHIFGAFSFALCQILVCGTIRHEIIN